MIEKFISQVKSRGLARTNRYEVSIPFPEFGTWGISREASTLTNLLCDSVSLPGVNIATVPHRFYGESREMPYEKGFDPITMTYYVDSGMQVKTAFDRWCAMIIDPLNRTVGYYDDYTRDIDIIVENVDGSTPMTVTLREAFPKTVGSIQMDSGSRDIMKLSVTWQYKYWISTNTPIRAVPVQSQDRQTIFTGTGYDPSYYDV